MASKLETLKANLEAALGARIVSLTEALGELTLVVKAGESLAVAKELRDNPSLRFEQLLDLCGVDYQTFGDGA
ncbi:MAG: NADH-quinone oxidoreductase subunit C, partial [Paraburkholderia sp.]|nr:NADH-quinone oxidoreductase subunit C [Paraburkholderia sp.]